MRNAYLKIISICLALVFAVSCGSRKSAEPLIVENTKTITKETLVRDTVVVTQRDSVRTEVMIDCPEGGTPKIRTIYKNPPKGRILQPPQVTLSGNKLTIDCKAEAEKLALKLYDKYVKEHESKKIPVYIEKPFKWYHKGLMCLGGIFMLILALFALTGILKWKKVI